MPVDYEVYLQVSLCLWCGQEVDHHEILGPLYDFCTSSNIVARHATDGDWRGTGALAKKYEQ